MQEKIQLRHICTWIGEGEGCRRPVKLGTSYCEAHHDRIYMKCLPEMATYIIEKELKDNETS